MSELADPQVGEVWQHYSGRCYLVLHIANTQNNNPNYPVTVVYQNIESKSVWTRPLSDWHRSMKYVA